MSVTKDITGRKPGTVYTPDADIIERDGEFEILLDMPGVDGKSLEITIDKGELTIEGHPEDGGHEGQQPMYLEHRAGSYRRVFRVSDELDHENTKAAYGNGTLSITIPRAAKARPRMIEVKAE